MSNIKTPPKYCSLLPHKCVLYKNLKLSLFLIVLQENLTDISFGKCWLFITNHQYQGKSCFQEERKKLFLGPKLPKMCFIFQPLCHESSWQCPSNPSEAGQAKHINQQMQFPWEVIDRTEHCYLFSFSPFPYQMDRAWFCALGWVLCMAMACLTGEAVPHSLGVLSFVLFPTMMHEVNNVCRNSGQTLRCESSSFQHSQNVLFPRLNE